MKMHAKIIAPFVLLSFVLSGCTIIHSIFGPAYDPNGPAASPAQRKACREHCRVMESDRLAGMCAMSCVSLRDPWYSSHTVVEPK